MLGTLHAYLHPCFSKERQVSPVARSALFVPHFRLSSAKFDTFDIRIYGAPIKKAAT